MKNLTRTRLLATTMIVGATVIAAPVSAQANSANQPNNPVTQPAEAGASTGPIEGQTPASGSDMNQGAGDQGAIIVTGSRIPQPNLTSAAPVSVVTSQEIKLQGTTRIEDLLNTLPQVTADQNGGLSNGSTGVANVSLRDLGPQRTLVLVNGRRLMPGDTNQGNSSAAADLNNIPSSLVKSVQVLTGGASSTYGADAVAGVVNFIMDTDYTGFKVDGQYSFYQHDNNDNVLVPGLQARQAQGFSGFGVPRGNTVDGGNIDTSLTIGGGFDDNRGHIVAYAGYRHQNAVNQSTRDYSACTAQSASATNRVPVCGGSATSQQGTFFDSVSNAYQVNSGNTFSPGFSRYNFAPTNYYQRQDERYTAGFFSHYDVSDAIKPYAEFMFMDDRTQAQIAPSGDFGNTLTVNCDNPELSAQQLAVACRPDNLVNGFTGNFPLTANTNPNAAAPITFFGPNGATYREGYLQILRRNVEGGPRIDDIEHTAYRAVIGTKGDIAKGLSYDAYYQYGRTLRNETYINDFSVARLTKALDVVTGPNGTPVCRSALPGGSDPACVPYNIFAVGGVTQGAVNYLSTPGFQRGLNTEQIAHADITLLGGEYGLKSPLADDGLGLNAGFEHRRETLSLRVDQEFAQGDLSGQGGATPNTSGGFNVDEGFVEAQLPLIHDNFIHDLSLEGGYRYSRYRLDGGGGYKTNTYKIAATFSPIKDITFRGTYNRAVRAPSIQELFSPQRVALDGTTDPCAGDVGAGGTVNGYTAAQCANTGVTALQFGNISQNPAGQYNGLIGGTTSLHPEKATTKTAGIVLQPRFAPRLAITADYYDIKIKNAISIIGENTILNTCAADGTASLCSLIHRNPATGSLWLDPSGYVTDVNLNIGSERTKGVDFTASYVMEVGRFGSLGFNLAGTYLDKFDVDNGITQTYDCKGYYGATCGAPLPKWKGKARLTYTAPFGIQVSGQWRYVNHVKVDVSSDNPSLSNPALVDDFSARIKSQSYFDVTANATIGDHYVLSLGVQNIADKRPPLVSSNGTFNQCQAVFCNGNTYPGIYDALGRYVFARISLEL